MKRAAVCIKLQAELSCSNIYLWENGEKSGLLWLQLCFPSLYEAMELRVRKQPHLILCSWTLLPAQRQDAESLLRGVQDSSIAFLHHPYSTSWAIPKSPQVHSLVLSPLRTLVCLPFHLWVCLCNRQKCNSYNIYFLIHSDLRKRICALTFLMGVLMDKVQSLHDRDEVLCLILLNA